MAEPGVRLAGLSWTEVADRAAAGALLAVPVGSTEQHGPHLPLSTDTDVATHLATALARRRGDVLVAPALAYGSSGEHDGFAGTLSIGQQATRQVLIELGRSATATFSRVLLVVGHGGNAEPVAAAVRVLRGEGRDVLAWAPRFPGDAHAGGTETSIMLALHPDAVRSGVLVAGATQPLAELMPALRSGGVREVSRTGVLGDPTRADADHGRALLADALDELAAAVDHWTRSTAGRGATRCAPRRLARSRWSPGPPAGSGRRP
jgi:mycofactocin precursor peptide peptidase